MPLTDYLIDSDSLVTTGFAGTGTTRTGAYDPNASGNNVIRGTLTTTPVAICGLGNLSNTGPYRVIARVYAAPTSDATADDFKVRLSWLEGAGPLRSNDWTSPVVTGNWSRVDLGTISIPEATLGTQRWTGQIEAYSEDAGDVLDVDYIMLFPTSGGYGVARAPATFQTVTSFSARDEFDQAAGNLTGKTLPVGGTWATSGDATDLAVETTGHTAQRSTTGDSSTGRRAIASLAATAAQLIQVDFKTSALAPIAVIQARYVDSSNYLSVAALTGTTPTGIQVTKTIAGSPTVLTLPAASYPIAANAWYTMRAVVDADGRWFVWIFSQGGQPPSAPIAAGQDSALATGGTLASGQCGFRDINTSATAATRNFDNFAVAVPTSDAVVFSGRSAEIRHDSAIRQDSTGTYWGPIHTYRGSRFFLTPDLGVGHTNEIVVGVSRNDLDTMPDDAIADSTTVTIHYVPRFLVAPR